MADQHWADVSARGATFTLLDPGADAIMARWADGDERFNPDAIEQACRTMAAAWLRGVSGSNDALDALCGTSVAQSILAPTEHGVRGRLTVADLVLHGIATYTLSGTVPGANLEVWVNVTGLRYLNDLMTGEVVAGIRDGDPEFVRLDFTDTWHLTLAAESGATWQFGSSSTQTADQQLGYPYVRRAETVPEMRERTGETHALDGRRAEPRCFQIVIHWVDHDVRASGSGPTIITRASVPTRQEAKDAVWAAAEADFNVTTPGAVFRPSILDLSAIELLEPVTAAGFG